MSLFRNPGDHRQELAGALSDLEAQLQLPVVQAVHSETASVITTRTNLRWERVKVVQEPTAALIDGAEFLVGAVKRCLPALKAGALEPAKLQKRPSVLRPERPDNLTAYMFKISLKSRPQYHFV